MVRRHRGRGSRVPGKLTAALLLLSLALVSCAHVAEPSRTVAIGDVHGAYREFTAILRKAELIDETHRWIGGSATLVQLGDFMDRGTEVKQVVDLLMSLENQAAEQGGKVIILMGNHESYNLMGHFDRESTPPSVFMRILAGFADADSESRRQSAYREYQDWEARFPRCAVESRDEWMDSHPPGFIEYQEALSPSGQYGRWLRRLPAAARVGDIAFVHGGISPELIRFKYHTPDKVNRRLGMEIHNYDRAKEELVKAGFALPFSTMEEIECVVDQAISEIPVGEMDKELLARRSLLDKVNKNLPRTLSWMQLDGNGPLWFRGYAEWTEEEGNPRIDEILEAWGVEMLVVGHTPSPEGMIRSRFGNRVFLLDTAMTYSNYAGVDGRPSALEIRDPRYTAVYDDDRIDLTGNSGDAQAPSLRQDLREPSVSGEARPPKDPELLQDDAGRSSPAGDRVYLGPDGNRLPFQEDGEILDFLRTARIQSTAKVPTGLTKPRKLLLERNGIRANAIFHHMHSLDREVTLSTGEYVTHFRDSYRNQVAAYELSRLLGIPRVSPTVLRSVDGKEGSVQLWIENAFSERDRVKEKRMPPDIAAIHLAFHDMRVFDNLINNIDRNQTNILYDADWRLWYIDHTRAFGREHRLPSPGRLRRCSVPLWEKLQILDAGLLKRTLEPFMGELAVKAVAARQQLIVKHLQEKMETEGTDSVLFEYPLP